MHLKISSAKRWPFCPGGDELINVLFKVTMSMDTSNIETMAIVYRRAYPQALQILWKSFIWYISKKQFLEIYKVSATPGHCTGLTDYSLNQFCNNFFPINQLCVHYIVLNVQISDISLVNSLWLRDTICHWRSSSMLVPVMACCLTAPSHYLNQCWLSSNLGRAISQEISQPPITKIICKMTYPKFHLNLPGANELITFLCKIAWDISYSNKTILNF